MGSKSEKQIEEIQCATNETAYNGRGFDMLEVTSILQGCVDVFVGKGPLFLAKTKCKESICFG